MQIDEKALEYALAAAPVEPQGVAWRDESTALHWIDRYASGIDAEPQMRRILACVEALATPPASAARSVEDELVAALRENFCPRPCNGRPDDFSVGHCFDAGECGCMNRAALARTSSKEQSNES